MYLVMYLVVTTVQLNNTPSHIVTIFVSVVRTLEISLSKFQVYTVTNYSQHAICI